MTAALTSTPLLPLAQDISIRISQLLSACSDSQRSYTHALSAYRTSLQQLLDRETALKTIVRDREILVNRMIKLNNKKPAESALEAHQGKIEEAQRELTACEGEWMRDVRSVWVPVARVDSGGLILRSILARGGGRVERSEAEQLP